MAPSIHHLLHLLARTTTEIIEDPPVTTTSNTNTGTLAGTTAANAQTQTPSSTHKLSKKTTIIIIVAVAAAILITTPFLICCCLRARRRKRKNYSSATGHASGAEWKLSENVHSNASKPSKPTGKPTHTPAAGYQHDPEASHSLLSHANAPGAASNSNLGHGHSASSSSIGYTPASSSTSGHGARPPPLSSHTPPIHVTAPQPSQPEYDGHMYGGANSLPHHPTPSDGMGGNHPPQNPIQHPPFTSPPVQQPPFQPPPPFQSPPGGQHPPPQQQQNQPFRPPPAGGPVPLYLQHASGGEADEYFSARSIAAREAMGQEGGIN